MLMKYIVPCLSPRRRPTHPAPLTCLNSLPASPHTHAAGLPAVQITRSRGVDHHLLPGTNTSTSTSTLARTRTGHRSPRGLPAPGANVATASTASAASAAESTSFPTATGGS